MLLSRLNLAIIACFQRRDAVDCGIFGHAVADCLDCRLFDKVRRVEVRLAADRPMTSIPCAFSSITRPDMASVAEGAIRPSAADRRSIMGSLSGRFERKLRRCP